MVDVIVLLGAPGSGKSSVGERLGELGLRWREWEAVIVERWGSREDFIASKQEALPALHQEIRDWIDSGTAPAVLETTGLSDAPLLAELQLSGGAFVVRLDVTEHEALRRVAARESGRHLTDEIGGNRRVWVAFNERIVPDVEVDLAIDTDIESIGSVVHTIAKAVDLRDDRP